jgi:DNA-binding GntR family transcriptional regulator
MTSATDGTVGPDAGDEHAFSGGRLPAAAPTLAEATYRRLRSALMFSRFAPHQRLKVRDLAAEMEVSETPVREALMQLVREGALELKPRHYIRVRRLSRDEYLSVREIRMRLEPLAAEQAVRRMTGADVERLEELHERYVGLARGREFTAALEVGIAFHLALFWRSNNPILTNMIENLWVQVAPLFRLLYGEHEAFYDSLPPHEQMIHAIRMRDTWSLQEALCSEMIEGGEVMARILEQQEARELQSSRRPRYSG